ncbi:MAG: hypothetical protein KC978_24790, partial [Candidatus Omnitrophica bacterium]|nr:hypothetical protein [Candidatus Omnitrophota bacterium]
EVGGPLAIFIGIVIFSPVIETFLMASGIWLLSFITQRPLRLALLSAILWAALHSLLSPPWGIGILWPFFVFSCAYLAWRKKTWWRAIWVTICIHAFQNFFPGLAVIFATT